MTRIRETFDFDIKLAYGLVTPNDEGVLEIQGVVRHSNDAGVDLSASAEDALRLGFRLLPGEEADPIIFENRARFSSSMLEPQQLYDFSLAIPRKLLRPSDCRLMMDFVYEAKYWFHDRGRSPHMFRLHESEQGVFVLDASTDSSPRAPLDGAEGSGVDAAREEEIFVKGDPALLPAMVESLRSIMETYGASIAVEFAYRQILGRCADPGGLHDKSTHLSTGLQSIEEMCAKMLGGDEYHARPVLQHRDPRVVIASWSRVNGT